MTDTFERLRELVDGFDVEELIRTFDVRFDAAFRHAEALWLLEMKRAFEVTTSDGDGAALAVRVGAYWCRIVSSDVRFELAQGLADLQRSRGDAHRLRAFDGEFAGYAAARWADGAGKLLYRTGSHARGRILFEDACGIAESRDLWWCLPDLRSNFLRAQLEEARLAGGLAPQRIADAVTGLQEAVLRAEATARDEGVALDGSARSTRHREFQRGYLSLQHNLSIAVHQAGDVQRSGELAERVYEHSRRAEDPYRQAQALLQRITLLMAQLDEDGNPDRARSLLDELGGLRWNRGTLIARQQLAVLDGGERGIRTLLDLVRSATTRDGASDGLDVEFGAFGARRATDLASALPELEQPAWFERIRAVQLEIARSVRQVIALPAYKRAYSRTMRPVYLAGVQERLDAVPADPSGPEWWEGTLALVEESTGRELLDLMSSASLPRLDPPAPSGSAAPRAHSDIRVARRGTRSGRRSAPRRSLDADAEPDRLALLEREREFENQFLRNPLQAAPHDPEIARKAEGFVINQPGTCIVRYFGHGDARRPERLAAFVIRGGIRRPVPCGDVDSVRSLVRELLSVQRPTPEHSARIWELLVGPLWPEIAPDGREPEHLVIIPSDELFAIPFHIAAPVGGVPLGARLPLSHSVSLATFLLRSRDQLRRQRVEASDDLAAMVIQDYDRTAGVFRVSGDEVAAAGWALEHLHLAGDVPADLVGRVRAEPADWAGLARIAAPRPEFFVYAGHGTYHPDYGELGPFLQIRDADGGTDRLTSYDVALRLRLPRNRLTVLGACLAGQGAQTAGGDVAGFLRGFIAAGAGAIALPLWQVGDWAVVDTAGHLLRASRKAVGEGGTGIFDVVDTLYRYYRDNLDLSRDGWIDEMPLALYT